MLTAHFENSDIRYDATRTLPPYVNNFYQEQTPTFLHYALLSGGAGAGLPAAFSSSESFASCDIGCGFGLTPIIAATVDPTADVWGFDFNSEQILDGKALADAAGVANITLLDASFETFLDHDTPDFDLVTLHGIYSWVSPQSRQKIIDILNQRLKPGGVVYISYNCITGWASAAPMQQFFSDYVELSKVAHTKGASEAISLVNRLRVADAAFFDKNPQASKILDIALQADPRYLVHEYLAGNWSLFSLAQVASELKAAGLNYAGSANLTHAFDVFHMTPDQHALLDGINDKLLQEGVRDFIMNPLLRKDIFVKGTVSENADEQAEALMNQRFCAWKADQLPQRLIFPHGSLTLTADAYVAIKSELIQGPASARTIIEASDAEPKSVLNGLKLLAHVGFLNPALPKAMTAEAQTHTDRFNAALAEFDKNSGEPISYYTSPITGGGVLRQTDPTQLQSLGIAV